MKKILLIIAFLFTVFANAQGGPKVDVVKFRGEVTTTVRNTFDVPTGERWLIWNVTTTQFEHAGSDDVWVELNADQTAVETSIADSGDYYTATDVEAALQEIAADVDAISTDGFISKTATQQYIDIETNAGSFWDLIFYNSSVPTTTGYFRSFGNGDLSIYGDNGSTGRSYLTVSPTSTTINSFDYSTTETFLFDHDYDDPSDVARKENVDDAVSIDASGFSTNLDSGITSIQLLAEAVDTLTISGGGSVDESANYTWTGNHFFNGGTQLLSFGANGFFIGEDEGVSGKRWYFDKNSGTEKIHIGYQTTNTTTASGVVTTLLYTLNETGIPEDATDLVDKAYADALLTYPSTAQQYYVIGASAKDTITDADYSAAEEYKSLFYRNIDTLEVGDGVTFATHGNKPVMVQPTTKDSTYIKKTDGVDFFVAGQKAAITGDGLIVKNRSTAVGYKEGADAWYWSGDLTVHTEFVGDPIETISKVVAYWTAEDLPAIGNPAGNWTDRINGYVMVAKGSPTVVAGDAGGKAASYDGVDDAHANDSDALDLDPIPQTDTFAFGVRIPTGMDLFERLNFKTTTGATPQQYAFEFRGSVMRVRVGGAFYDYNVTASDNDVFIANVSTTEVELFVNGVSQGSQTLTGNTTYSPVLSFGASNGGTADFTEITMERFFVANDVLTAGEITTISNSL